MWFFVNRLNAFKYGRFGALGPFDTPISIIYAFDFWGSGGYNPPTVK